MHVYIPIPKLYTILFYTILFPSDLMTKKVPHPHPHPHPHPNKKKVFGVESEILIKYKRIKWTLAVRLRTYSQGENLLGDHVI